MRRRLRILLVEDEALVADYVSDVIDELGHAVAGLADTGEKALQQIAPGAFDLAVLDIKLRGPMTGIDVARHLGGTGIPHLFLSGSGDPATRRAAEATAPLGFLQKPLDSRRLRALLDGLAGG